MDYSSQQSTDSTSFSVQSINFGHLQYPPPSSPQFVRVNEDTKYFKYIPASYDPAHLETMLELEKCFPPHFYQPHYVHMRTTCMGRAKEQLSKWPVKPHPSGTYEKLFIKNWQKLMLEKKKELKLSDSLYDMHFYHPGDFAYKIHKFDALRLLMKTPVNKIKQQIWNRKYGTALPERYKFSKKPTKLPQQKMNLFGRSEKMTERMQNKSSFEKPVGQKSRESEKGKEKSEQQNKINRNVASSEVAKTSIKEKKNLMTEAPSSYKLRRSLEKPNYNELMNKPAFKPKRTSL